MRFRALITAYLANLMRLQARAVVQAWPCSISLCYTQTPVSKYFKVKVDIGWRTSGTAFEFLEDLGKHVRFRWIIVDQDETIFFTATFDLLFCQMWASKPSFVKIDVLRAHKTPSVDQICPDWPQYQEPFCWL